MANLPEQPHRELQKEKFEAAYIKPIFPKNQPSSLGVGRVTKEEGETEGKTDIRVVADPTAPPLWARFYDLEEGRPFFCDRDGQPKRDIQDIGYERRNGYSWYSNSPAALYKRYETWKKKYHDFL